MRTNLNTSEPLDVAAVKRFCDQHFSAALSMHMVDGMRALLCILPLGSSRSFTVSLSGDRSVSVSDDDETRTGRFCEAIAARFRGSIETR